MAGVDEHANGDRHLAAIDQIIEHVRNSIIALEIHKRMAVLENHQAGGLRPVVLRGYVHPVIPAIGEYLAGERQRPDNLALRHSVVRLRIGTEQVHIIGRGRAGIDWGPGPRNQYKLKKTKTEQNYA